MVSNSLMRGTELLTSAIVLQIGAAATRTVAMGAKAGPAAVLPGRAHGVARGAKAGAAAARPGRAALPWAQGSGPRLSAQLQWVQRSERRPRVQDAHPGGCYNGSQLGIGLMNEPQGRARLQHQLSHVAGAARYHAGRPE
ncbi:hypothetical protein HWV62_18072 [Athelia sp. TMB]|nr:hypothetical protein HWV62_18072 [Athelia sp. TMB]